MAACSINGDLSTHGNGAIIASTSSVRVNGSIISVVGDNAANDNLGHTNTDPSTGSSTVSAGGAAVHRIGDSRQCGATTVGGSANVNVG